MVATVICSGSISAQELVWVKRSAPTNNWIFVMSSADGTKLVANSSAGFPNNEIWISTNSGLVWTESATPVGLYFTYGAMSADGAKLAMINSGIGGATIYTSTNSGLTWNLSGAPGNLNWQSIASSSDGTILIAGSSGAVAGSGVFTSTNSGATWKAAVTPTNGSYQVASSADGRKLVAADMISRRIYISTNSGFEWFSTSAPSNEWRSVASSSDGSKLIAGTENSVLGTNRIYTSTNSGLTWLASSVAPERIWFSVASSADGMKAVALASSGLHVGGKTVLPMYHSTNSGLFWEKTISAPTNRAWSWVASSADGTKLVAVTAYGEIYNAYVPTNPPSITQQPQNLASCPGSSSLFTVAVTGTPPFAYQWRKEGTNLADGGHVAGSTTATLTLQSVSASDVASYDVVVTNLVGSVTSSPAILIVGPVPAKATPIIVNGFIIGATVTDGGCGYTNSPFIVFNGQGGSGAGGYGQVSGGSVTNIVVTNAGSGYPSSAIAQVAPPILPTVSITHTNTPAAKASPVIISGFIVGAIVTAPGSAYTTPPAVSFTDDTGVGAAAYTQISNGSVTNIVVTSAGSGYSSNTTITIPPAAYMNAVIPSAQSLMLGQNYQLETTDNLNLWMNYESSFFATNSSWSSPGYWLLRDDDSVFFRLRMLP